MFITVPFGGSAPSIENAVRNFLAASGMTYRNEPITAELVLDCLYPEVFSSVRNLWGENRKISYAEHRKPLAQFLKKRQQQLLKKSKAFIGQEKAAELFANQFVLLLLENYDYSNYLKREKMQAVLEMLAIITHGGDMREAMVNIKARYPEWQKSIVKSNKSCRVSQLCQRLPAAYPTQSITLDLPVKEHPLNEYLEGLADITQRDEYKRQVARFCHDLLKVLATCPADNPSLEQYKRKIEHAGIEKDRNQIPKAVMFVFNTASQRHSELKNHFERRLVQLEGLDFKTERQLNPPNGSLPGAAGSLYAVRFSSPGVVSPDEMAQFGLPGLSLNPI